MPTLADLYSAIGTARRKASDVVANPLTSLQQMVGYANDRARALNELTAQAAQEGMQGGQLFGPASRQLGAQMAEAYNPVGMTVFHGSPHIFEKFDISKIGTGEGAQAYGRGLYMAQNPEVAKKYAVDVSSSKASPFAPRTNVNQNAIDYFQAMLKGQVPRDVKNNIEVSDDYIKSQISELSKNMPSVYKVDLPDTHIRRMLDWDAPLKDQPAPVRKLAKSLGMDMNDLGGDLLAHVGKDEAGKQILEKAGIRGIKYLDEKSRWSPYQVDISVKGKPYASSQFPTKEQAERYAAEKQAEGFQTINKMVGTRNFVVFNPEHLTILERNAQPIK